jgi:hypothetical protein
MSIKLLLILSEEIKEQGFGMYFKDSKLPSGKMAADVKGYDFNKNATITDPSVYSDVLSNVTIETDIPTMSTSDLKNTIKTLGFTTPNNGKSLDEAGTLNPKFSGLLSLLLSDYKTLEPSSNLSVGSGNDNFHKNLQTNSLHKSGRAVDVTLPKTYHETFIKLLEKYKESYSGFNYINEYVNPSEHSTGGHFHLQYTGN